MSVDPSSAPFRPAFVRGTDGLYYKIGGGGVGGGLDQPTADLRYVIDTSRVLSASAAGLSITGVISASGQATVQSLKIATGAGAGKVLTSDASGVGTWQTATGGSGGGLDQATADGLYVNVTGDNMSGNLNLTAPAGTTRAFTFSTGAVGVAGSTRWAINKNNASESGSNNGSNFVLSRYSDAGTWLGDAISVTRSDGQIMLTGPVPFMGTTTPTADAHIASKLYVDSGNTTRLKTTGGSISGPVSFSNNDNLVTPLSINRTQAAVSTSDADTFVVNYMGDRATWANEKGNLRTSNKGSPAEDAFKIIGAPSITGNHMIIMTDAGTSLVRVGAAGNLIVEYGFRLSATAATPGVGKVLTSDSVGNATWQTPAAGGGLQTRTTVVKTTASLAAGVAESSTITMAAGYRIFKITCSAPARVRLYSTTTQRDSDATRQLGALPSGNHGLVMEFIAATGLLGMDVTPAVAGHDGKATPDGVIPIIVTNTGTGATAITVTISWIRTE